MQSSSSIQLTISPDRWLRIRDLFDRAVTLTPRARAQLLHTECVGDNTLREQVMSLLIASGDDAEELERRANDTFAGSTLTADFPAGRIIGRYRVVRVLGRGGMGAVYLAERADEQYQQRVALKVMSRGLFHSNTPGRFRAERQILARLTHPNIARLLDGGETEDGTPFLVMEHVEGVSIDEYCVQRSLTIRARLRLMQLACSAVQYAHQSLVVHRDLKAANILVTADGIPKLLDFGIAKLIDPHGAGDTVPLTRLRDRIFTPEHASPEQIRGEPIGTATDVYGLGALLYTLLTRVQPFDFRGRSLGEIERIVCDSSLPAPSVRLLSEDEPSTRVRALARDLAGDLDNIVLKAMHRDPQRRYASAAALAQDIQNYLDGRPVEARPDTWLYRTRKLLGRHAVTAAAATFVALLIATLVTFYTVRLAAQRDAAERERQTAANVSDFMMDVFRRANPNELANEIPDGIPKTPPSRTPTVRDALDAAARRIDHDLADQPRLRLTLMRNMSQAYNGLGSWAESRALMEKAVDQERALFGEHNIELARADETLGTIYNNSDQFDAAGAAYTEAWRIRTALGADQDAEGIELLSLVATNLRSRQRFAEALEQHRHAETLARALKPPAPRVLGTILQAYATTLSESGDQHNAERYAREAMPLLRGVINDGHDLYANTLATLATALRRQFKLTEAETLFREFVARQTQRLGPDHLLVGRAQNNFANLLRAKGNYADAEKALTEALRIYRLQTGPEGLDVAVTYHNLGGVHHESGNLVRSLQELDTAIEMKRKVAGVRSPQVVSSLLEKSAVLRDQGELQAAQATFAEAASIALEKFDANDRRHSLLLLEHGRLQLALGATAEAERDLREAVSGLRQGDDPARLAEALTRFGEALAAVHKRDEARAALTESLALRRRILPAGHKAIAETASHLAGLAKPTAAQVTPRQ
ncbi:MAG: serine/threonine-protein kinase [Gammaproteobacteria bacterium]